MYYTVEIEKNRENSYSINKVDKNLDTTYFNNCILYNKNDVLHEIGVIAALGFDDYIISLFSSIIEDCITNMIIENKFLAVYRFKLFKKHIEDNVIYNMGYSSIIYSGYLKTRKIGKMELD